MWSNFNKIKVVFVFALSVFVVFFFGYLVNDPDPDVLDSQQSLNQQVDVNVSLFNVQKAPIHTLKTRGADTIQLNANPGPANNGGSPNWGMFLNLIAGPTNVTVTRMSTASTALANAGYSVIVYTRSGTALGGPVGSGPGSSSAGWTLLDTVPVTQGPTANGISLVFQIPPIEILAGDTVGVAIQFLGAGPRYFGTGTPPYSTYSDANMTLITGDGRSAPFTPSGTWFASRAMCGEIGYVVAASGGSSLCFSRSGLNLVMPDNSPVGVRDTIKVTANAGNITDIAVVIESVTSTWIGDLIALLNHAGQTDTLLSRIGTGTFGNNSDDLTNVRFTDSATAPIAGIGNVISPSNASWLPGGRTGVDSLRKHFVNQDISGNWELYMSDNAAGDAGQTLNAWSICFYSPNITQIISSNTETPDRYSLGQNYPNPFNPTTKIRFALPKAGLVSLKVYDMLGREVQTLVNQQLNAGEFIADFDGANLSSGTYFYRLQVGDFVEIKKMVLLK